MGFITPQQKWQKEELKHWFDTGFDSIKTNGLFNFLDKDKIAQIYSEYQKGTFKDYGFIWRLNCLSEWKKEGRKWLIKEPYLNKGYSIFITINIFLNVVPFESEISL